MIFDISDSNFKNILNDEQLFLPIRWNGTDFLKALETLFRRYINRLEAVWDSVDNKKNDYYLHIDMEDVHRVTELLLKTIKQYFDGFPAKAFATFNEVMKYLSYTPLEVYQKSVMKQCECFEKNQDKLNLFRTVKVSDNITYGRSRVFHTPYNLRSKVSTNRYSIAGYPSLYLGTSLDLCCDEINIDNKKDLVLAASFKLNRSIKYSDYIRVIDLGIKPQDFFDNESEIESSRRHIPQSMLKDSKLRAAYLLWYPLIAACSFIRRNKNDPFAAEYIIPQLLMQWVRGEIGFKKSDDNLIGIRYFSCASVKASDMGFNYVFPTSGRQISPDIPFCAALSKTFRLTSPVYIHEFDSVSDCERKLIRSTDFDYIL